MTRDEILATIEAGYAARMAGDSEALSQFWAEGGTFELAGDASLLHDLPGSTGPEDSGPAVDTLMRLVEMSNRETLQAVVEGNKAATIARVTLSVAGREKYETLLFDFWEFDEAGKIRSLLQFADTAKVAVEMRALAQ